VELTYVFASIVLLVLLISWGKVQPFLAFLVASSVAAVLLGLPLDKVPGVLEKGIGNILASLLGIVCIGAMFGKLIANSGAAQKIALVLMRVFGEKHLTWALMFTGSWSALRYSTAGLRAAVSMVFLVFRQTELPPIYHGITVCLIIRGRRHHRHIQRRPPCCQCWRRLDHAFLHRCRRIAAMISPDRFAASSAMSRNPSRCSSRRCDPKASCPAPSTASRAHSFRWR
jgi:hypothetical protein